MSSKCEKARFQGYRWVEHLAARARDRTWHKLAIAHRKYRQLLVVEETKDAYAPDAAPSPVLQRSNCRCEVRLMSAAEVRRSALTAATLWCSRPCPVVLPL